MKQDYTQLIELISNQKENFPLDQQFYTDPSIYNIDSETFFYNQWIFVGHEFVILLRDDSIMFKLSFKGRCCITRDQRLSESF